MLRVLDITLQAIKRNQRIRCCDLSAACKMSIDLFTATRISDSAQGLNLPLHLLHVSAAWKFCTIWINTKLCWPECTHQDQLSPIHWVTLRRHYQSGWRGMEAASWSTTVNESKKKQRYYRRAGFTEFKYFQSKICGISFTWLRFFLCITFMWEDSCPKVMCFCMCPTRNKCVLTMNPNLCFLLKRFISVRDLSATHEINSKELIVGLPIKCRKSSTRIFVVSFGKHLRFWVCNLVPPHQ